MKNSKGTKIGFAILGVILIISGCYRIYQGLYGNDKKADEHSQNTAVSVGESISDKDGVEFCVTSVENTKAIGDLTTENNYVVVNIKIDNQSDEPYDVNTLRFVLLDGDTEYEYCEDAVLSVENMMYMDTINPNLSKEYVIVYETADTIESENWRLKIKSNAYSESDSVYINLN